MYNIMLQGKFDQFQIGANNTQHVTTHRNRVAKCRGKFKFSSKSFACLLKQVTLLLKKLVKTPAYVHVSMGERYQFHPSCTKNYM